MAKPKEYADHAYAEYETALREFNDLNNQVMLAIAAGRSPDAKLVQREEDARVRLIAARRAAADAWRK